MIESRFFWINFFFKNMLFYFMNFQILQEKEYTLGRVQAGSQPFLSGDGRDLCRLLLAPVCCFRGHFPQNHGCWRDQCCARRTRKLVLTGDNPFPMGSILHLHSCWVYHYWGIPLAKNRDPTNNFPWFTWINPKSHQTPELSPGRNNLETIPSLDFCIDMRPAKQLKFTDIPNGLGALSKVCRELSFYLQVGMGGFKGKIWVWQTTTPRSSAALKDDLFSFPT